jgi:hypothetical protein
MSFKDNIIKIKTDYSEIDKQHKKLCDFNKRKEIIDFVFEDGVEMIHEYSFRKMYL